MEFFALVALAVALGWLLGVIGFFQARRARRELWELRRALAEGRPIAAEPDPLAAYRAEIAAGERVAGVASGVAAGVAADGARPSPFGPRPGSVPAVGPAVDAAAPRPEPAAEQPMPEQPVPEPAAAAARSLDIETLLTQRWGVWVGGAALLLAGVFLVRYAVEEGFLGPEVRTAMASLWGVALLAGAEWLRRRPAPERAAAEGAAAEGAAAEGVAGAVDGPAADGPVLDRPVVDGLVPPSVLIADHGPAALAASGAAVLFGAAYAAGVMYGFVPPLVGFGLMGLAALVGMVAALRFGPMSGLVGVAAAFATPLLVETETPSAPGLFGYLLFVTASACVVVRLSAWAGLGWIATVAGALWVGLAATGSLGTEYWAPGLFVPAAAALHLLLLPAAALEHPVGRRLAFVPLLALGLAGVALSGEVADMSVRAGVLLLAPLSVAVGAWRPALDRLPWVAAGLFLLVLLVWAMPAWQPTGEVITIEGTVQAFLPGEWAPQVIRPLLITAAVMAGFFAAAGLWLERRAERGLVWAGLAAAVPVLALGVTYLQVARFQADTLWALAAAALAAGHVAAAEAARREGAGQRAGAHAAGAVAALCVGAGIVLHDHWMTLAVALMLPALAWIEARAELPALRRVALAVAALVLVRLLGNWYVLDYAFGRMPVINGLWLAYAVPAACFWGAARMFLRRGDDLLVRVLEAGAVAFASVFVALQIRHWHGVDFTAASDLLEVGLHVSALWAQALAGLFVARRSGRAVLAVAWRIQGGLALFVGAVLLLLNPVVTDDRTGQGALIFAYLVPAALAGVALMQAETAGWRRVLGPYALLAGFVWLSLLVRAGFHPGARLGRARVSDAEMWTFSGAWLMYGAALLAGGIALSQRALRLAALGVIALVAGKVFLLDMGELGGLWRVLSFLGLGVSLIALGAVFRRFVGAAAPAEDGARPPDA